MLDSQGALQTTHRLVLTTRGSTSRQSPCVFAGESFREDISCTIHGGKAATIGSPMDTRLVILTVWSNTSKRTQKPSRSLRIGPNEGPNVPVMGLDERHSKQSVGPTGSPILLEISQTSPGIVVWCTIQFVFARPDTLDCSPFED